MKIALSFGLLLTVVVCRGADFKQIEAFYQWILNTTDDSQIVPGDRPAGEEEAIQALPEEEVKTLLALAWRCWRSRRPKVHDEGRGQLYTISWRPDAARLLEPYIQELAELLAAPEEDIRAMSVDLLGAARKLPKARTYLIEHIDHCDSAIQLRQTAVAVLDASPSAQTIHRLLAAVKQRPEFQLKGDMIQLLGLSRITAEEALQFIRSGLSDADGEVRRNSIDAIGRMPGDVRSRFTQELRRIASDPDEPDEIRSKARSVLASQ